MLRLLLLCACFLGYGSSMALSPAGVQRRLDKAKKANSWQKRLDKALLDVDVSPNQRVRLLQKVARDAKIIQRDVKAAVTEIQEKGMGKGHPLVLDLLFPTGTTARADLEGLAALRKQVPELAENLKPPTPDQLTAIDFTKVNLTTVSPVTVVTSLATIATDESKQKEVLEEAKNALRSTPKVREGGAMVPNE